MKGIIVKHHSVKSSNIIIPVPDWMPQFSLGCQVTAKLKDPDTHEFHDVEGMIVGMNIQVERSVMGVDEWYIVYSFMPDDFPVEHPFEVLESEIKWYTPTTNEFDSEFYANQEQQHGPKSEADVLASQDKAAGDDDRGY